MDTSSANRFYSQLYDWDAVCPWVGILLFLLILSVWIGASPEWVLEVLIRVGSKMGSWSLLWPLGVAIIQIINQKTCFNVHRGCCQFFPEPCLILYSLTPLSPPFYSITEILALYIGQMNLNVKSKSRKAVEIWLTSSQSSSFLGAFVIVSCPRVVATRGTCYCIPDSAQSSTDKINHWASHPLTRPLLLMLFRGISTQGTLRHKCRLSGDRPVLMSKDTRL